VSDFLPNESVDYAAREIANRAEQKIDSHEDRCGERWGEARKEMRALRDDVIALRRWMIYGILGVVSAQFTLIIWLLDK
jgi:hypothetical protein